MGATTDLRNRKYGHQSRLKTRTHHCEELQSAFDRGVKITYVCQPCQTATEALELEQKIAFALESEGRLLNRSLNTVVPFKGMRHSDDTRRLLSEKASSRVLSEDTKEKIKASITGLKRSEETCRRISAAKIGVAKPEHVKLNLNKANELRSLPVSVDGIIYPSAAACGRAHGVDTKTVHNRIASTSGRFDNWKFHQGNS